MARPGLVYRRFRLGMAHCAPRLPVLPCSAAESADGLVHEDAAAALAELALAPALSRPGDRGYREPISSAGLSPSPRGKAARPAGTRCREPCRGPGCAR